MCEWRSVVSVGEKKKALLKRMDSTLSAPLLERGCVQTSHNIWPVSSHTAGWNILKCRRQTEPRKNSMRLDCATVPQDGERWDGKNLQLHVPICRFWQAEEALKPPSGKKSEQEI